MSAFDIPKESALVIALREDAAPKPYKKQLPAIHTLPAFNNSFKLSKRADTVKLLDCMSAICSHTGIAISIDVPAIPNNVFEYINPLSFFSNAKGIIYQGEAYLQKLETQILAGIWITAYTHYDLIQFPADSSGMILNAMLRTAGKQVLIDSLLFVEHLNTDRASKCPRLSLDYNNYKDTTISLAPILQEYTKTLRDCIYHPTDYLSTNDAITEAKVRVIRRHKLGMSDCEREYEEQIAANKREIRVLLATIAEKNLLNAAFITFLKTATSGKNLAGLHDSMRAKIAAKLKANDFIEAQRLAKLIEESKNPYDIFASVDSALDRASDHMPSVFNHPAAKKSLAEILAEKKAAKDKTEESKIDISGSEF